MENEEWRMDKWKWRMKNGVNGEWRMENEEW